MVPVLDRAADRAWIGRQSGGSVREAPEGAEASTQSRQRTTDSARRPGSAGRQLGAEGQRNQR